MKLRGAILFLIASLFTGSAFAHPFDDRAEVRMIVTIVDGQRASVTVMYLYETVYASYNEVKLFLDRNDDGSITREERDLRFKTLVSDLLASLTLEVNLMPARDGRAAEIERVTLLPDPARYECIDLADTDNTLSQTGGLRAKNLRLGYTLAFSAALKNPLPVGRYSTEFSIINTRIRLTEQSENMRAFDERGKKRVAVSPVTHDRTRAGLPRMRFTWVVGLAGDPDLTDSGDPSIVITPPVKPEPPPISPEQPRTSPLREEYERNREDHKTTESRIEEMFESLRGDKADMTAWALALLLAFGLGAYHALQPGHGKTLVAGYLIGTQGKKSDAIFLGVVVTLAHTSGVLILMGGAWAASKLWPDTMIGSHKTLAEWIAVAVGGTIFLMGAGLVIKRAGAKADHAHDAFGRHLPGESHDHDHPSTSSGQAAHSHDSPVHHGHSHHHEDGTQHLHEHEHAAVAVASDSDESWLREHEQETHEHVHPVQAPSTGSPRRPEGFAVQAGQAPEERLTRWQILRLGILGGVIPCPTAFVIGLISFQQQWYLAGLIMVVVFSLGLAVVLSAIGLTLVVSRSYLTRKLSGPQGRVSRFLRTKLPVIGALIITLIGFAMVLISLLRLEVLDLSKLAI